MRIEKQMLNDALRVLGKAVYQTSPVDLYRSVRFVGDPGDVRVIDDCTTSRTGETQINGVMLRPDDPDMEKKKDDCFRRASYLAKTNTKGNAPKYQREMFSSRMPK